MTTQDPPTRWLTTRQCAEILHVTPGRIRHFVLDGRLPAYKGTNGRDLLISSDALANLVRRRRPSVQPT